MHNISSSLSHFFLTVIIRNYLYLCQLMITKVISICKCQNNDKKSLFEFFLSEKNVNNVFPYILSQKEVVCLRCALKYSHRYVNETINTLQSCDVITFLFKGKQQPAKTDTILCVLAHHPHIRAQASVCRIKGVQCWFACDNTSLSVYILTTVRTVGF